jgi:glycosyltransferase involved in cell wall biosynthesis
MDSKKIIAVYAIGTGFSGQRFAIEILLDGLEEKDWQVIRLGTPSLDRVGDESKTIALINFLLKLSICIFKEVLAAFSNKIIYAGLGQTKLALVREGLPLLIRSFLPIEQRGVISLHGSLFLKWSPNYLEAKVLRQITKAASYISILGATQQQKLIELGIPQQKVTIVDNTCLIKPLSQEQIIEKHQNDRTIKILHLSSLVETKGYPEFVEAIQFLQKKTNKNIEAILCGKITDRKEDNIRFPNPHDAKEWIDRQLKLINNYDREACTECNRVRLSWINGAVGEEKAKLFREAHIFVLPTRYSVEAQPIVILEALASGCAVITTKVGEISSTLSGRTAILSDDYSAEAMAREIVELVNNSDRRQKLAIEGLSLFHQRFARDRYIERWEELLENLKS